jgi:hypothetical protein
MKLTLRKTALVLQLILAGAVTTVVTNPEIIPAPYRPLVYIVASGVAGVLPSPVKRTEQPTNTPAAE